MNTPSPLVLIVGFLGSGKTTFLRELLPLVEAQGMEPYVIINDYANARVDASSLQAEGRSVTPINGNCICCDSVIELIETLMDIPESDNRIVFIEANGTTDPTALIEHLLANPQLSQRFAPLLQITVIDLKRWQKRHWHNELEQLQAETASHLFLTRTDSESPKRRAEVLSDIEWFNPRAEVITAHALPELMQNLPTPNNHTQKDHAHGHHHDLAHAFVGIQLELTDPVPVNALQQWLRSLPSSVLRVKGVVRLEGDDQRWFQFQRVDDLKSEATFHELAQDPVVHACAILIGVHLDQAAIVSSAKEFFSMADELLTQPA